MLAITIWRQRNRETDTQEIEAWVFRVWRALEKKEKEVTRRQWKAEEKSRAEATALERKPPQAEVILSRKDRLLERDDEDREVKHQRAGPPPRPPPIRVTRQLSPDVFR